MLGKRVFAHALNEWWDVEVDEYLFAIHLRSRRVSAYLYLLRRGQPPTVVEYINIILNTLADVPRKYPSLYTWILGSAVENKVCVAGGQGYKDKWMN